MRAQDPTARGRPAKKAAPILRLTTEPRRDALRIKIDGRLFRLRDADELSFSDRNRCNALGVLLQQDGRREAIDDAEMDDLLDRLVRAIVVEASDDLVGKLTPAQRLQVIDVFVVRAQTLGFMLQAPPQAM